MDQFKEKYDMRIGNPQSYRLGYKRCSECEYYILNKIKCPCCGDYLRSKPRNNKARQLYNQSVGK